jgi:hypothetical protein
MRLHQFELEAAAGETPGFLRVPFWGNPMMGRERPITATAPNTQSLENKASDHNQFVTVEMTFGHEKAPA